MHGGSLLTQQTIEKFIRADACIVAPGAPPLALAEVRGVEYPESFERFEPTDSSSSSMRCTCTTLREESRRRAAGVRAEEARTPTAEADAVLLLLPRTGL